MRTPLAISIAALLLIIHKAHGQDATWLGGGGGSPNEWTEADNWNPATVPTGTATFTNNGAPTSVVASGEVSIGDITFAAAPNNAPAYTIEFDDFLIVNGAGVINNSTNTQTLNLFGNGTVFENSASASGGTTAVTYNNSFTLILNDSSTAGNAIIINNSSLAFNNSSSAGTAQITNNATLDFFDSSTAGNATITNSAAEVMTFHNISTAGTSSITNNGTLYFTDSSTADSATIANNSGATLDISGLTSAGISIGQLTGAGNISLGSKNLTIGGLNGGGAISGVISGGAGGSLTKIGTGTLILSGVNTYAGGTTISGGTLQVGNGVTAGATLGTGGVTINSGATLTLDLANGETFANAVTDNGHVIADDGVFSNYTISSVITGSGDLTKSGSNTVTVTGANTYTGGTTISGGTLQLGNAIALGASLGTGGVTINSGATLTFDLASGETFANAITDNGHIVADSPLANNFTISSVITGSGDFTKIDSNAVTVTGANTYTGGTTITGGILQLGNGVTPGAALGTGLVTINFGTALALDLVNGDSFANAVTDDGHIATAGTGTYTMSGMITGTGDFTQSGMNTVIVSGANNYGGGTTISGGTLMTQNASALGTGTVTLSGGKLVLGTNLTISALNWGGGQLQVAPASATLNVTGAFANTGSGGNFVFDTSGMTLATYNVVTFGSTTFIATDFTQQALNPNVQVQGTFAIDGDSVQFTPTSATATGPVLSNAAPASIPTFADFIVSGPVVTGGPGGATTVNSLTFSPGSSLGIFDSLSITTGPVNLVGSSNINLEGGSLTVSQLNILPGGLLDGSGSIYGNVVNEGVLSPGHSPGIIRISGYFNQPSSGLLLIQIGGKDISQHDLLAVSGPATLGGTLELQQINNFKLHRNDSITFLTADGGITGKFATVDNGFPRTTILEPTVVYSSNSVALEAQQGSFKQFAGNAGLTPNQQAVGGMLDSAVNDHRANTLISYMDDRILTKLPGDLEKISPDALTSVSTIGVALATVQSQNLQRRTDDLRSGASGFNAANLAINGDGPSFSGRFSMAPGLGGPNGNDGKDMTANKEVQPAAPAENRWGAFLSGTGDWVSVGDTNNARGYDLESGGFTLGVDYKVCPNFAVGLMAGYTGTTSDLPNNGRIYVNGGKVGVYATTFVGGWYADVAAFGGYDSYDTRRSALQGDARGSTEGGNVDAMIGTGYDFKAGGLTFGPTATFNYTYVGTSAFDEYGSLAPLNIHGGASESLRTAFGIKASYGWKVGGIVIKPEVRAAWQHEYGDAAYDLDGSLASGAGSGFTVTGPKLGRDSALVGAGFAVQCSERCATYFYYDGELGRQNYESNAVTGGIRIAF